MGPSHKTGEREEVQLWRQHFTTIRYTGQEQDSFKSFLYMKTEHSEVLTILC